MKPMPSSLLFLLAAVLVLAATASETTQARKATADPYEVVRGMTISCSRTGRVWESDAMVETMRKLKSLGVNWVTIHPYAGILKDGSVGGNPIENYSEPSWLKRPIEEAHRLGLKIMIKPHLAYWGSGFSWRGDITFETKEQWSRFFSTYESWITWLAEICGDADAFVVGTELDQTAGFEDHWRRIIKNVRAKTRAPLTYSAGWDSYEKIGFWDALDVIGIQSYFPLVDHEGLPTPQELETSWSRLVERLDAYAGRHNRKIVLGELGYNRSSTAALRPWEYQEGGDAAEETQRRCLSAALRAIERSDAIVGAFLWKWFPGEGEYGNFLKSTPAMREVIRTHWGHSEDS